MWREADARRAYNAYGIDLIRTAGLLVRTTPSAIFRASILFQRLQRCINANFRSRYLPSEETKRLIEEARGVSLPEREISRNGSAEHFLKEKIGCTWSDKVEYLIPNHATHYMASGLTPLVDLFAPLDFCVSHIIDHEDVGFLAAACLLVAVKMEDPGIRIRHIVNVFMRLSQRRCGITSMSFLNPPSGRYEDFKTCVVEAEEILLQQTGFQTFVECPHKYVVIFLNVLVEDGASTRAENVGTSPAFTAWLSRAISWVNDAPRCERLAEFPATELAAFAVGWSCPGGLTLPKRWNLALGVSDDALARIQAAFGGYLEKVAISSREELDAIRAVMPKAEYRTVQEKALAEQRASASVREARQANEDPLAEASPGEPDEFSPKAAPTSAPCEAVSLKAAELLGAIGLPYVESHEGAEAKARSATVASSSADDDDDDEYEDLRQVQRSRRKAAAAEEMQRKHVEGGEGAEGRHRRRHRSPDRHPERTQSKRHHHPSRRTERYGDERKPRERDSRAEKAGRGGRRYDLKRDHGKREDERRRRR